MASTIDPFKNGSFNLDGKPPIRTGNEQIPFEAQPYLTGQAWDQYSNPTVYQADKAFREWASHMVDNPDWKRIRRMRKYRYSELFQLLFNRPYDPKDVTSIRVISKIFAYYSTSINKYYYNEKKDRWLRGTCYCISTQCLQKPAYSLKLRLEEMSKAGVLPTRYNMRLPKDNLEPGHARNPRTEANKQARAERARLAYNEYQRKQRRVRADKAASEELGDS